MKQFRYILTLFALLHIPFACIADQTCDHALSEGKEFYKSGDYNKAKQLFEFVLNECGANYQDASVWLAKCSATLTVSKTALSFDANAGVQTISVVSNRDWRVEHTASNMFAVLRNGNTLQVTIYENTTTASRSDYFIVKTIDGSKSCKVSLQQSAPELLKTAVTVEPNQLLSGFSQNGKKTVQEPFVFSVSATQKVMFSSGNLQFNAALGTHRCADGTTQKGTWRFAPNQWDYIGKDNNKIAANYTGWIDLFGWGTSGWNSGAKAYLPWAVNSLFSDYFPGGNKTNNLVGAFNFADWGVYNQVDTDPAGTWRTLSYAEWNYVLKERQGASSLCGQATVNGVFGFVLLPDDFWAQEVSVPFTPGYNLPYTTNAYSISDWSVFESHGAVFLPAAGVRVVIVTSDYGMSGRYVSATQSNGTAVWRFSFTNANSKVDANYRANGYSVRLVKDVR